MRVWEPARAEGGNMRRQRKCHLSGLSPSPMLPSAPAFKRYLQKLSKPSKTHNFSTVRTAVLPIHQNVLFYIGTSITVPSVKKKKKVLFPLVFSSLVLGLFIE